jgi:hypothetical protein
MTSMGHAFPGSDPVGRFLVSACMAANDIERAHRLAGNANAAASPDFSGYVRWSLGFLVEAQVALAAYRGSFPEVSTFLKNLPGEGTELLRTVTSLRRELGAKLAEHTRNHSFHYPAPNRAYSPDGDRRLEEMLVALSEESADVAIRRDQEGRAVEQHFEFADKAALGVNFAPYATEDVDELHHQQLLIRDAALAYRTLVTIMLETYLEARGLRLNKKDL